MRKLKAMGVKIAILKSNSQVIIGLVDKSSKARNPALEKYLNIVERMEGSLEGFSIKNIPIEDNEHVDMLAKIVAQGFPLPREVFFEVLSAPSLELMERAVLTVSATHTEDWRMEIITFLQGNHPIDDEAYIKRMQVRTRPYRIIAGELFKEGDCTPLLKCLSKTEG